MIRSSAPSDKRVRIEDKSRPRCSGARDGDGRCIDSVGAKYPQPTRRKV
jgi:hypothetical protein